MENSRKNEEKPTKTEEIYRLIWENTHDLIAIIKIEYSTWLRIPEFLYEYINEAAHKRFLGYSNADLIGQPLQKIIAPADLPISLNTFLNILALEKGSAELRILRKEGTYVWLDFQVIKLKDSEGMQRILLIGRDITERKMFMEELQRKNEALEELNRIRDDFYSGLAHDIRSPLTSIKLVIEMLAEAKNLELDQRNLVQILVKNTMHLERITNELMEYIRLKKGELELKEDFFRFSDLISQLESELEPLTKENGLAITKTYDPDAEIIMDRYQITKVIRNLLENAIRYSFREGQIHITSKVQEPFWTFSIRDFGLGISKDDLAKLFTPFMRSRQAQEMHREGLGIGLMVCNRIIDLYEGTLWAASDGLNHGT